ncbi:MAG TPA: hypothetical protein VFK02_01225 [Kofleriaceae bacterium]|nr:hypothetical protein [Kofleriaceae bacterium]
MRKLLLTTLVFGIVTVAQETRARADFALGLFLGEPTGLDLKLGMGNRSSLDIVLGYTTFRDARTGYGHLTYLVTPVVARGSSVLVPLRLGIGAALYGPSEDIGFAVRAPFEVGLRLRSAPLEFYGEIALALEVVGTRDDPRLYVQGGLGLRFYF